MKTLNEEQKNAIARIQLSAEKILEVEKTTGWQYAQNTHGHGIRFEIPSNNQEWKYRCGLVVWLHKRVGSEITIGVWANNGKSQVQDVFRNMLGSWAPMGMTADFGQYVNKGKNPDVGHVGDWHTGIENTDFGDNVETISRMVDAIKEKLADTGINAYLQTGTMPNGLKAELPNDGAPQKITNDESIGIGRNMQMNEVRNLIVFGAPGTGKSHKLEADRVVKFGERYERVTFYPTYSYAQYVGTYKPVMKPKVNGAAGEEEIAYEFVPGPFLRVLVKALNAQVGADGKKPDYCLIIEEINRANAAAVFGDVFQLLDRDSSEGKSEYSIAASDDVKKFLAGALTESGKDALRELTGSLDRLKIPANMYIWATMNSADQGVFPVDTAFKRRWEFEYVNIDNGKDDCAAWTIEGKPYNWNRIREFMNGLLSQHGVNEDKLMGAHFVRSMNNVVSDKAFKSKVLMYLWEDAARMCRRQMFGDILTYSDLCDKWSVLGIKVFEKDSELTKLDANSPLSQTYAMLTAASAGQQQ